MSISINLLQECGENFLYDRKSRDYEGGYLCDNITGHIKVACEFHDFALGYNRKLVHENSLIKEENNRLSVRNNSNRKYQEELLSAAEDLLQKVMARISSCHDMEKSISSNRDQAVKWEEEAKRSRQKAELLYDNAVKEYRKWWFTVKNIQAKIRHLKERKDSLYTNLPCSDKERMREIQSEINDIESQISGENIYLSSVVLEMRKAYNLKLHYAGEIERLEGECRKAEDALRLVNVALKSCKEAYSILTRADNILNENMRYLSESERKITAVDNDIKNAKSQTDIICEKMVESSRNISVIHSHIEEIKVLSGKTKNINDEMESVLESFGNKVSDLYDILEQIKRFDMEITIPRD